ncbi:hypothetical protein SORBI_3005G057401 [Sorghum bicolor]|uniref:Uncharacterized protein n=1 Tax=Sorghum bicolor TaxID=4558 RepID=A0A1Z5RGX1_SORBI|nr:hypothetical protein SORBI_3005G057401 [Sorghum bicolor]
MDDDEDDFSMDDDEDDFSLDHYRHNVFHLVDHLINDPKYVDGGRSRVAASRGLVHEGVKKTEAI